MNKEFSIKQRQKTIFACRMIQTKRWCWLRQYECLQNSSPWCCSIRLTTVALVSSVTQHEDQGLFQYVQEQQMQAFGRLEKSWYSYYVFSMGFSPKLCPSEHIHIEKWISAIQWPWLITVILSCFFSSPSLPSFLFPFPFLSCHQLVFQEEINGERESKRRVPPA